MLNYNYIENLSLNDKNIFRNRLLAKIGDLWNDLPITNTWSDVFDGGITKGHTNWQLYGSRKPNHEPYCLKYVYDTHLDPHDGELMFPLVSPVIYETVENFPKLSARYPDHPVLFMTTLFANEYNAALSSSSSHTKVTVQNTGPSIIMTADANILNISNREELDLAIKYFCESLEPVDYELREAYEYTMILPKSFYDQGSFSKWIRVGWALCNISPRLFIVWVAFSAQSSGFNFKDIREDLWDRWSNFDANSVSGLTKRSIMYWARQECKASYEKVHGTSVDYYVDMTLGRLNMTGGDKRGSGDFDIATVLYHLYKDEYVCVSIRANIWYRFRNHKWTEIDSGTSLRRAISEQLRDVYTSKARQIFTQLSNMDGEDERAKNLKKRQEMITAVCDRLSRTNDKKNIMIEAKELFYDANFLEKLDMNPYLMCFNNGVVDFKEKTFRDGKPEDYVSLCTNINYNTDILTCNTYNTVVAEIKDVMHKLFPDPQLHSYMWDHLASRQNMSLRI